MTDIAEKMRRWAFLGFDNEASQDMLKAADEIERLRQVLENTQQARILQGKAIIDANNEITNLRAAVDMERQERENQEDLNDLLADEVTRLRAALEVTSGECKEAFEDNAKLRAALEEIILDSYSVYAIQVARAALGGEND